MIDGDRPKKKKRLHLGDIEEQLQVMSQEEATEARTEKKRFATPQETLERAAEELNKEAGVAKLDEIPVDREIANVVSELEVSNQRPGWVYCWVYTGQNGIMIRRKQAEGWIVVQGDDPEAKEVKESATTVRRIGDTILMRLPTARWEAMQQRDEELTRLRMHSSTGNLQELGRKHGITVHTTEDASPSPVLSRAFAHAAARSVARGKVTDMIKTGTVPGMPAPGR